MANVANTNIANIKPPKAPNLPIPPNQYSQEYLNILTNALRLYFNQLDLLGKYLVTPDIGYFLNSGYGGFSDSTTQTIATINTPQAITFDTTDIQDTNLSLLGGNPDILINPSNAAQILILFPAIYNIQFSLQLESTNATAKVVWIWPRINGVDVLNSATKLTISGASNFHVASWNWLLETTNVSGTGDYFELMWAADNTNVNIVAAPAAGSIPAIPSAILTVSSVSA